MHVKNFPSLKIFMIITKKQYTYITRDMKITFNGAIKKLIPKICFLA